MANRKSPEKPALTRDRVLSAAVSLADEQGIGALSMRQLGARLGVEAMSLYNHVRNKDEILDGIVEAVVEEIAVPRSGADWRSAMRERAVSARRAFDRHPWVVALMDTRMSSGPSRLRYFDAMLGTLRDAGFPYELAARAFSVLDCYIYGFAVQKSNLSAGDGNHAERAGAFRNAVPAETYPHLARVAELTAEAGYDEDADFDFGLALILDGLERALEKLP
jgi:AcrR family transcriptional regulator